MVAVGGFLTAPALANFVGHSEPQQDTPYVTNPWDAVVKDYERTGYTDATFQNLHGNTWTVWTAESGNTLIWSKTAADGRGVGFNCRADDRPNHWASCLRYDLATGRPTNRTALTIRNGILINN